MTTVFLSGSRNITRLNDDVRNRIQNIIDKGFNIVVGDANGADKAMQCFLAEKDYSNVAIYCSGKICRNNVGSWKTQKIKVDSKLKGRAFYTEKDKAMAAEADFGFVLWDGKSEGSISNVLELLNKDKKAVVYFSPQKKFFDVASTNSIKKVMELCEFSVSQDFNKSVNLKRQMKNLDIADQHSFNV